jgi:predicted Zn-dependent protease
MINSCLDKEVKIYYNSINKRSRSILSIKHHIRTTNHFRKQNRNEIEQMEDNALSDYLNNDSILYN